MKYSIPNSIVILTRIHVYVKRLYKAEKRNGYSVLRVFCS